MLLNAVLDQGPDVIGVRELLKDVTNNLYKNEVRIFHRSLDFFKELNISIDNILLPHKSMKKYARKIGRKQIIQIPKDTIFFSLNLKEGSYQ
ncbi:MAG: hypothetical protein C0176_08725 [Mesoaciditoga sp.]|nr:MAG: hypothetical protein C0176_08725 [Mesoaciditoga sp.]